MKNQTLGQKKSLELLVVIAVFVGETNHSFL